MHGNGLDAHLLACPDDTESDLAAVGDQYFFKHSLTSNRNNVTWVFSPFVDYYKHIYFATISPLTFVLCPAGRG
jgi:hypothetical protein